MSEGEGGDFFPSRWHIIELVCEAPWECCKTSCVPQFPVRCAFLVYSWEVKVPQFSHKGNQSRAPSVRYTTISLVPDQQLNHDDHHSAIPKHAA
jgi:hypothetical protein